MGNKGKNIPDPVLISVRRLTSYHYLLKNIVMNQFLIIVRGSDHAISSPEEMQQRMALFGEWVEKVLNGRYVSGAPLEEVDARLLKSKTEVLTDGPFMESKEMISGYMVINANDIDEAVALTKENPLLGKFQLEVRRLKPMM
jgi:hypothetical protein